MKMCITKGCWNWMPYSIGLCNKCEEEKMMGLHCCSCGCYVNPHEMPSGNVCVSCKNKRIKRERNEEKRVSEYRELTIYGGLEVVVKDDYLKVVEENEFLHQENENWKCSYKELKRQLNSLKECKINPLAKFRPVGDWRKDNEEIKQKLKDITSIANARGEEIEKLRLEIEDVKEQLETMTNLYNKRKQRVEELENQLTVNRGVGEMKNITEVKCCQVCAKFNWRQYLLYKNIEEKNTIERHALSEDCEICKWKEESVKSKTKFEKLIENTSYGFEDSWMLSYKVEGMKEPIIQHHLTKEECEIIYGNMNDITYWFMEVMKND